MKISKIKSVYLESVFDNKKYPKLIDNISNKIQYLQSKIGFDGIAFTGISGASIAFPVSYKTKIPLLCVRKYKNCHSYMTVEGNFCIKKYIILDDFIETGATIKKILSKVDLENDYGYELKCVGIVLWQNRDWKNSYLYKKNEFKKIPVFNLRNIKIPNE